MDNHHAPREGAGGVSEATTAAITAAIEAYNEFVDDVDDYQGWTGDTHSEALKCAIQAALAASRCPGEGGEKGIRPFSTYPEDRERLLSLARKVQDDLEDLETADEFADLVIAILEDEAVAEHNGTALSPASTATGWQVPDGELADAKAESVRRGKMLTWMRNKLIHVSDNLDDQGDQVAFGSTNDCDTLKDVIQRLDDFNWERIMGEETTPDVLGQLRNTRIENSRLKTKIAELEAALSASTSQEGERITARAVPYSSIVGSSVTLHAENGFTIAQLGLRSVIPPGFATTPEAHKSASVALANWLVERLDGAPLPPPPAGPQGSAE